MQRRRLLAHIDGGAREPARTDLARHVLGILVGAGGVEHVPLLAERRVGVGAGAIRGGDGVPLQGQGGLVERHYDPLLQFGGEVELHDQRTRCVGHLVDIEDHAVVRGGGVALETKEAVEVVVDGAHEFDVMRPDRAWHRNTDVHAGILELGVLEHLPPLHIQGVGCRVEGPGIYDPAVAADDPVPNCVCEIGFSVSDCDVEGPDLGIDKDCDEAVRGHGTLRVPRVTLDEGVLLGRRLGVDALDGRVSREGRTPLEVFFVEGHERELQCLWNFNFEGVRWRDELREMEYEMPLVGDCNESLLLVELLLESVDAREHLTKAIADVPAPLFVVAPDKDVVEEALDLAALWVHDDIQHPVDTVAVDPLEVTAVQALDYLAEDRGLHFVEDFIKRVALCMDVESLCARMCQFCAVSTLTGTTWHTPYAGICGEGEPKAGTGAVDSAFL